MLGETSKWHLNYPPKNVESILSKSSENSFQVRKKIIKQAHDFSLYIHVPFCISKCAYCTYNGPHIQTFGAKEYVDCLIQEINWILKDFPKKNKVLSVYMGGGTPTILGAKELKRLINHIFTNFKIKKNTTFSLEATPYSIDKKIAKTLSESGVNRIYLGVQSFNEEKLKQVRRPQKIKDVYNAVKWLRQAGIQFISFDLLYDLVPNETEDDFLKDTLVHLRKLKPNTVSVIPLQHYDRYPEKIAQSYELNKLKPKRDSEYWRYKWLELKNILAIGYRASSYLWNNGQYTKIRSQPKSHSEYKQKVQTNNQEIYNHYSLSKKESLKRILIRHLHFPKIPFTKIKETFGEKLFWEVVKPIRQYISIENNLISISPEYNEILPFKTKNQQINYFILTFIYLYSKEAQDEILLRL